MLQHLQRFHGGALVRKTSEKFWCFYIGGTSKSLTMEETSQANLF